MKRHLVSVLALLCSLAVISCASRGQANNFIYAPEEPMAGEAITIKYNPMGTSLAGAQNINMIVYQYSVDLDDTKDVAMVKEGNAWTATFKPEASARGILIKFKSGDEVDNNKNAGFVIRLFGKDGNELPGSNAGLAVAYGTWGPLYLNMERDRELAYKTFSAEFEKNPGTKAEYLDEYLNIITPLFPAKSDSIIAAELALAEKKHSEKEDYLTTMATWYTSIKNEARAAQYRTLLLQKYPTGKFAETEASKEIGKTEDPGKKVQLAKEFEQKFPSSDLIGDIYDGIIRQFSKDKKYADAMAFIKENAARIDPYTFFSTVNRMTEENADLTIASEIAKLGVDRSKQALNSPSGKKPNYLSPSEWREEAEYTLGMNLFAYAAVMEKMDNIVKGLDLMEDASTLLRDRETSAVELYARLLLANNKYGKTKFYLEPLIKKGRGTSLMKDYLKSAYISVNGSDAGFDEYIKEYETAAKGSMREKLKKEMIRVKAPDFSLLDLDGKQVALSSLKGKTLILDFWATWCSPCRASFPGMKKAVEMYSSNPDVRFLFINTRERVADKKKNAADFIAKNNYPFHVLLDNDSRVLNMYKVPGIPTKFVIDKDGMIRFKVVGYDGNTDQMVEEIKTMLSMVN
ncbi:MAG: TlpA family protein disulfide reductase [Ignavibacteriales bacterium]